jgi:hypothetical protein
VFELFQVLQVIVERRLGILCTHNPTCVKRPVCHFLDGATGGGSDRRPATSRSESPTGFGSRRSRSRGSSSPDRHNPIEAQTVGDAMTSGIQRAEAPGGGFGQRCRLGRGRSSEIEEPDCR